MSGEITDKTHNLIMENRKKLDLSGVAKVNNFDENEVCVQTCLGQLTIRGEQLHITRFNTETGDMLLDGSIYALVYTTDKERSGGFLSKLFR